MPNTDRGGGISRKITKPADRKRLKQVASELDVPNGMGVICVQPELAVLKLKSNETLNICCAFGKVFGTDS